MSPVNHQLVDDSNAEDWKEAMKRTVPTALSEERTGLKGKELAELLEVGDDQVSRWRNGHSTPEPRYLLKIATKLNVNAHWLLTGDGAPDDRPADALRRKVVHAALEASEERLRQMLDPTPTPEASGDAPEPDLGDIPEGKTDTNDDGTEDGERAS